LDRALLPEYRDEGVEFLFPGKPVRSNLVEEEARRLVMYIRGVLDGRWSGSNLNDPIDQDVAFARLVHQ
jgi:hypothetical protein